MKLQSRVSRPAGLAIVSFLILSSLLGSPAQASAPTFDLTGLKLPAGASVSVQRTVSEYDGTNVYVKFDTPGAPANTLLKLSPLKITGLANGVTPTTPSFSYFDLDTKFPNFSIRIAESDATQNGGTISISGVGTYEKKGDISFPGSYTEVISNLDALGLEVTSGYNVWSSNGSFGFYVEAKTKPGVSPFQVILGSASISANELKSTPITIPAKPVLVTDRPTELDLGTTGIDPQINLTNFKIVANFRKFVPSTVSQALTPPREISIGALLPIFYDESADVTTFGFELINNSSKAVNLDLRSVKVVTNDGKVVGTYSQQFGLTTLPAAQSGAEGRVNSAYFTASGNQTEGLNLKYEGAIKFANPSRIDSRRLVVPAGYKVQPIDFDNLSFDASKKRTLIFIEVTRQGTTLDSPTLILKDVRLGSGKAILKESLAAPLASDKAGVVSYFIDLGYVSGDQRIGKVFTPTGRFQTAKRTTVVSTATIDPLLPNIEFGPLPITFPENWKYDKAAKQTSISAIFLNGGQNTPQKLYTCKLNISVNGKSAKPISPSVTVGKDYFSQVDIARIPGDIRSGANKVEVSGVFTSAPCSP